MSIRLADDVRHRLERQAAFADERPAGYAARLVDEGVRAAAHIRPLLRRAWELIHDIAFAEALYVALSESLAAPLLTCDTRLARTRRHEAEIEP